MDRIVPVLLPLPPPAAFSESSRRTPSPRAFRCRQGDAARTSRLRRGRLCALVVLFLACTPGRVGVCACQLARFPPPSQLALHSAFACRRAIPLHEIALSYPTPLPVAVFFPPSPVLAFPLSEVSERRATLTKGPRDRRRRCPCRDHHRQGHRRPRNPQGHRRRSPQ